MFIYYVLLTGTASMQRILRTSAVYEALNNNSKHGNAVLDRLCPPHLASVFATIRKGSDGSMEWWTPLGGQAVPLQDLTAEQKTQLLKVLEQRRKSLAEFAEHLESQGQKDGAYMVRWMLADTDFSKVYSVDNQPVVIDWHQMEAKEEVVPAIVPGAAVAAAATAPVAVTAVRKRRIWPWLLALLLLLAAGLFAWWLWLNQGLVSDAATPQDLAPLDTRSPAEPMLENATPEDPALDVLVPEESADLATAQGISPDKGAVLTPPTAQSQPSGYACNPSPERQIPDFVTVFDTSGSMTLSIHASASDESWWMDRQQLARFDPERLIRILSTPTREEVAKHAYRKMLDNLHPDISTRLITFDGCESVVDHGLYNFQQRGRLLATLQQKEADRGTPLAASLRHAAESVDGVNKEAVIVLFIDGEDGCGHDVCALSAQIAKQQPLLKINVVDVSGNGLSSCAAELTGGRMYSSQDAEQIDDLLIQAIDEVADKQCM